MRKCMLKVLVTVLCTSLLLGCTSVQENVSTNATTKKMEEGVKRQETNTSYLNNQKEEKSTETIVIAPDETEKITEFIQETTEIIEDPKEIYVVSPEFELNGKYIKPVEQKKEVPEGFIEISTYEDFAKIGNNARGNYILMADIICQEDFQTMSELSGVLDGNGYCVKGVNTTISVGTI